MILSEREVHGHWLLDGSDPDVRSVKNETFLLNVESVYNCFHVRYAGEVIPRNH